MLLERTIRQLDIGAVPHPRAQALGRMGYLQWLGGLPGDANYHREAMRACAAALPFKGRSPAVAVFCDLLIASTGQAPAILDLPFPVPRRLGGAQARRSEL